MRHCLRTPSAIFFATLFYFAGSGHVISGAPDPVLAPEGSPAAALPEGSQPQIVESDGVCPRLIGTIITDREECRLLNSTLQNVNFFGISPNLTAQGKAALEEVASVINANPSVIVEIRAHTRSLGDPEREEQLSAQRALAVAQHLVLNGVQVVRLRAKAFGATLPVTQDDAPAEQRQNDRIELRALRP